VADDWQKIVEFVRSNVASDVYLNRCLVKARVDGKVVRLSSPRDFTEEAFDGLIRALLASRPGTGQTLGIPSSAARDPALP
jgi:hypothetical protein